MTGRERRCLLVVVRFWGGCEGVVLGRGVVLGWDLWVFADDGGAGGGGGGGCCLAILIGGGLRWWAGVMWKAQCCG